MHHISHQVDDQKFFHFFQKLYKTLSNPSDKANLLGNILLNCNCLDFVEKEFPSIPVQYHSGLLLDLLLRLSFKPYLEPSLQLYRKNYAIVQNLLQAYFPKQSDPTKARLLKEISSPEILNQYYIYIKEEPILFELLSHYVEYIKSRSLSKKEQEEFIKFVLLACEKLSFHHKNDILKEPIFGLLQRTLRHTLFSNVCSF